MACAQVMEPIMVVKTHVQYQRPRPDHHWAR